MTWRRMWAAVVRWWQRRPEPETYEEWERRQW